MNKSFSSSWDLDSALTLISNIISVLLMSRKCPKKHKAQLVLHNTRANPKIPIFWSLKSTGAALLSTANLLVGIIFCGCFKFNLTFRFLFLRAVYVWLILWCLWLCVLLHKGCCDMLMTAAKSDILNLKHPWNMNVVSLI